jgi:glycerol uptake facilitator-like aquaporin
VRFSLARRLVAEALGAATLLATVVGSGIMAERLAGGNVALALLGNTLPTGAMLYVLITVFGPVSGAHFNPAVSLVELIERRLPRSELAPYVAAQVAGAIAGAWVAHLMFDLPLLQASVKARSGSAQWLAEFVATFGLLATLLGCLRFAPERVAAAIGYYIVAAYWFTASTSFANPAVTVARSLTDTFSGIRPADAPAFIVAQIIGALGAWVVFRWLLREPSTG